MSEENAAMRELVERLEREFRPDWRNRSDDAVANWLSDALATSQAALDQTEAELADEKRDRERLQERIRMLQARTRKLREELGLEETD